MKDNRLVRIILKEQAKAEFEELNRIAGEQQAKGIANSDEIQLLKAIKQKSDLIRQKAILGVIFAAPPILSGVKGLRKYIKRRKTKP